MDPTEMERLTQFKRDDELEQERAPGCFAKLAYFFIYEQHDSYVEEYLKIRDENGGMEPKEYRDINNLAILSKYGIDIPKQIIQVAQAEQEEKEE